MKHIILTDGYASKEIFTNTEIEKFKNEFKHLNLKCIPNLLSFKKIIYKDKLKIATELLRANNENINKYFIVVLNEVVPTYKNFIQMKAMGLSLEDFLYQKMNDHFKYAKKNSKEKSVEDIIQKVFMNESKFVHKNISNKNLFWNTTTIIEYLKKYYSVDCPEISINLLSKKERKRIQLFELLESILLSAKSEEILY